MDTQKKTSSQQTVLPTEKRQLRACLFCGLVKTMKQFQRNGCENCESFLSTKAARDNVMNRTSGQFEGMASLIKPEESWVAKWLRNNRGVPGVYAVKVIGRLSADDMDELEGKGITYRPRDGTVKD